MHEVGAHGVHGLLGARAAARSPRAPPRTGRRSRCGTARSAWSRGASRRRSRRACTSRRPRRAPACRRVAGLRRGTAARARRPPGSRTAGRRREASRLRNQPSQTLSPRPSRPTRFIPSFQSPLPMRGRPCAPAVRPRSMARTQCSSKRPALRRHLGRVVGLRLSREQLGPLQERYAPRRALPCRR